MMMRSSFPFSFLGDVTAAQNSFATQFNIDIVQNRNDLTRKCEQCRSISPLHRGGKRARGFFRIRRTNYIDMRHQTN